eukprot:CAMPEP_0119337590 /NCGR_PEP_ID=MMETSP1333-20130426/94314_1 /TAXON_ID=418940 /ORGANISM="Scyphosphaera apsteinii, Strain RCC1455" /LENGTH=297 /DNA_ID=CAMNT_0007348661 /DNA_START=127 /DNA_END=1020 /DNA_ORIENTATION=+
MASKAFPITLSCSGMMKGIQHELPPKAVALRVPAPPAALLDVAACNALPLATSQLVQAVTLNSGLAAFGLVRGQRILTTSGLVHAWALGVLLWASLGWRGWGVCVIYLIGGSTVTKLGQAKKERLGIAEGRGGARGPENVWGSAATAAICALGARVMPARAAAFRVGFAASLATKLADTCASEVGKAYGRTTYLITTLRQVPAGTEGAVSAEGTAAGIVGSIVLAGLAVAVGLIPMVLLLPCVCAAFVANNVESLIGASAQGQSGWGWLTNEMVNFINTAVGAVVALLFTSLYGWPI